MHRSILSTNFAFKFLEIYTALFSTCTHESYYQENIVPFILLYLTYNTVYVLKNVMTNTAYFLPVMLYICRNFSLYILNSIIASYKILYYVYCF